MPEAKWRYTKRIEGVTLAEPAVLFGLTLTPTGTNVDVEGSICEAVEEDDAPARPSPAVVDAALECVHDACWLLQMITGRSWVHLAPPDDVLLWELQNREDFPGVQRVYGEHRMSYSVWATINKRIHPPLTREQIQAAETGFANLDSASDWGDLALAMGKGRQRRSFVECYAVLDQALCAKGADGRKIGPKGLAAAIGESATTLVAALDPWIRALAKHFEVEPVIRQITSHLGRGTAPAERTIASMLEALERVRSMEEISPTEIVASCICLIREMRNAYYHWAAFCPAEDSELFQAATVLTCEFSTAYWRSWLGITSGPPSVQILDETEVVLALAVHDA